MRERLPLEFLGDFHFPLKRNLLKEKSSALGIDADVELLPPSCYHISDVQCVVEQKGGEHVGPC